MHFCSWGGRIFLFCFFEGQSKKCPGLLAWTLRKGPWDIRWPQRCPGFSTESPISQKHLSPGQTGYLECAKPWASHWVGGPKMSSSAAINVNTYLVRDHIFKKIRFCICHILWAWPWLRHRPRLINWSRSLEAVFENLWSFFEVFGLQAFPIVKFS